MNVVEIGSVTFFTNVPRGESPTDEEAMAAAHELREQFESRLQDSPLAGRLVVVRTEYALGCILTTLTLGAALVGVYQFIKDYEDFRSGLLKLVDDLNGIRLRLKRLAVKASTWTYDARIPSAQSLETAARKAEAGQLPPAKVARDITWQPNKRKVV